jgi:hypothetical protein
MSQFPTEAWVRSFQGKLNTENHYAEIAKNWEGDVFLKIESGGSLAESVSMYCDLWH